MRNGTDRTNKVTADIKERTRPQRDFIRSSQPSHTQDMSRQAPESQPSQNRTQEMHTINFIAACIRNGICSSRREQSEHIPMTTELCTLPQQSAEIAQSKTPAALYAEQYHAANPDIVEKAAGPSQRPNSTQKIEKIVEPSLAETATLVGGRPPAVTCITRTTDPKSGMRRHLESGTMGKGAAGGDSGGRGGQHYIARI